MKRHACIFGLLLAIQSAAPVSAQGTAWTWVDNEGVTHFSDTPPVNGTPASGSITSMDIPAGYTTTDPEQDYYSITNQWQRAQQQRAEQDRLALERAQLRLEWYRASEEARIAGVEAEARTRASANPVILVSPGYSVPWLKHGQKRYPGSWHGPYRLDHDRNQPLSQKPEPVQHALGLTGRSKPTPESPNHQRLGPHQ